MSVQEMAEPNMWGEMMYRGGMKKLAIIAACFAVLCAWSIETQWVGRMYKGSRHDMISDYDRVIENCTDQYCEGIAFIDRKHRKDDIYSAAICVAAPFILAIVINLYKNTDTPLHQALATINKKVSLHNMLMWGLVLTQPGVSSESELCTTFLDCLWWERIGHMILFCCDVYLFCTYDRDAWHKAGFGIMVTALGVFGWWEWMLHEISALGWEPWGTYTDSLSEQTLIPGAIRMTFVTYMWLYYGPRAVLERAMETPAEAFYYHVIRFASGWMAFLMGVIGRSPQSGYSSHAYGPQTHSEEVYMGLGECLGMFCYDNRSLFTPWTGIPTRDLYRKVLGLDFGHNMYRGLITE